MDVDKIIGTDFLSFSETKTAIGSASANDTTPPSMNHGNTGKSIQIIIIVTKK